MHQIVIDGSVYGHCPVCLEYIEVDDRYEFAMIDCDELGQQPCYVKYRWEN